jgi:lipopolysaccharide export system permease protein
MLNSIAVFQGLIPSKYKRASQPAMLFQQALRRDLFNLAGAVFATLFTVMVTTTSIRLLGGAAANRLASADVLPLIAFASVNYIPVLMVLTLYITVLLALTRAYRDSEMVVWFASGLSLRAWIRPVLTFAMPFVILIAIVSLLVGPWANRQASEYKRRFELRDDVSMVAPGQFRESVSSNRVFFVESVNEAQTEVRNVFVTQIREGHLTVVASSGGRIETRPEGGRFLVLEDGRRWDGQWGEGAYRLMEFERYGLLLQPKPEPGAEDSARMRATTDLIQEPSATNRGELIWRLSLPVSGLLAALLAIPLAFVNPRVNQSVNLIVAMLIYVIYNNANSLMQAWVSQGRLPFAVGLLATHVVVIAIIAFMFWRRMSLSRLWPDWLNWRGARAQANAPQSAGPEASA